MSNVLKRAIYEAGYNLRTFSVELGTVKVNQLYKKLDGRTAFTEFEIEKISIILNKDPAELFFPNLRKGKNN